MTEPEPDASPDPFALSYYPDRSLNPCHTDCRTNLQLAGLLYEPLYQLDQSFEPEAVLAVSAASEDGYVWTVTLRDGLMFSDGSALTAQDVADTYLSVLADPDSPYYTRLAVVSGVTAETDTVVQFTLSTPRGDLTRLLDVPILKGTTVLLEQPTGSGPYLKSGESLVPNYNWWRTGVARPVQSIDLYPITETDQILSGFGSHAFDLVDVDYTGTNSLGFSGDYDVWDYPTSTLQYLGFNLTSGPCAQQALRQAVCRGVDRAALVTGKLSGHANAAVFPLHPLSPLYPSALAQSLGYDRDAAAALLASIPGAALGSDGQLTLGTSPVTLTLIYPSGNSSRAAVAGSIVDSLGELGLTVTAVSLNWDDYLAALRAGSFDLYLAEVRLTQDFDLTPLLSSGGSLNYGGYSSGDMDAAIWGLNTAGAAERSASAKILATRLTEDAPILPLCFKCRSVLTHWGAVSGLQPTQQNIFYGLTDWSIG